MEAFVSLIRPIHIVAGGLAIVFGFIALFAAKGGVVHRQLGSYFVYVMVVMALGGAVMALKPEGSPTNVVAGLATFYFVMTALMTVRRNHQLGPIDTFAAIAAFVICLMGIRAGMSGRGESPSFVFALIIFLAGVGDLRMIRAGGIRGQQRITRHLWRMCVAMVVASGSFFLGPPGRVPDIIDIKALLPLPVVTPLVVMAFWMWRLRVKKSFRGIVGVAAQPIAAVE
jgi:uncharacterized membrane protein